MTIVTSTGQIDAPAETVWNTIKDFRLDYLAGFQYRFEGAGVGATRTFDPGRGETQEKLESIDEEAMRFSYTMTYGSLPVRDYRVTLQVVPVTSESCQVEWRATFEPSGLAEEKAVRVIRGIFEMNNGALNKHLRPDAG